MLSDWITILQPEQEENRGRKLLVDKQIKVCPSCKRAWEKVHRRNHPSGFIFYPIGMIPTIGKKKIKCVRCKNDHI